MKKGSSFYGGEYNSFYGNIDSYGDINNLYEQKILGPATIVSFNDAVKNSKLKQLIVAVEPQQDLHGYDSPWSAGGEANKWDEEWELGVWDTNGQKATSANSIRSKNYIPCTENTTYYIVCPKTTFSSGLVFRELDSNKGFLRTDVQKSNGTLTTGNDCTYLVMCSFSVDNVTSYSGGIAVNYPASITTYSPYSNICPISGWMRTKVSKTGKNLLKYPYVSAEGTYGNVAVTVNQDGTMAYSGTADSNEWFHIFGKNTTNVSQLSMLSDLGLKAGDTIAISNNSTASFRIQFNKFDGTLTKPSSIIVENGAQTSTIPSDAVYCYIGIRFSNGVTYSDANVHLQLELGSTATAYEPYQGDTYDISWQSEAGTVYGGTLDVTNGVLTVDRAYEQMTYSYLSELNQNYIGWTNNITIVGGNAVWVRNWNYSNAAPRKSGGIKANCNAFPISMHNTDIFSSQYRIYFGVGGMSTVAEFLNAVQTLEANGSGLFIAYELATPVTYQLTPQQITTLLGVNNMWADTGDITIKYLAKK